MDVDDPGEGPGVALALLVSPNLSALPPSPLEVLGWRWRHTTVDHVFAALKAASPEVVVIDVEPLDEAMLMVASVVEQCAAGDVAVVALSAVAGDHERLLELGVQDVITLDGPPVWVARLRGVLRSRERIVRLLSRIVDLDHLAGVDLLTGLPNRRRLDEQIRILDGWCKRRNEALGILIIDVDHLKDVNDTFGHTVGDDVLCEVGARLRGAVRAADALGRADTSAVGRWGGDEYLVAVACADPAALMLIGRRLLRAVAATPIPTEGHAEGLTVTVSIGASSTTTEAWTEVLSRADTALYRAKADGRSAVQVA